MKFTSSHLVDEIEWEHAHFILEKRYSVIFFFGHFICSISLLDVFFFGGGGDDVAKITLLNDLCQLIGIKLHLLGSSSTGCSQEYTYFDRHRKAKGKDRWISEIG